jgi:hypothetical protein
MDRVHHHYEYKFGSGQFFNLLIGFGLWGSSIFLLIRFPVDNTLIVIASFMLIVGLIPICLTAHYLRRSLYLQVRIDQDNGIIEITRDGRRQIWRLKDVKSVDIEEQKQIGLLGFDFDFAKYTFTDWTYCIVTNMMTSEYFIPAGLHPTIKQTIFPIIWRGTNV